METPSVTDHGLLLLEMHEDAVTALVDDLRADIPHEVFGMLDVAAQVRLLGYLSEKRLAGDVRPDILEGLCLSGAFSQVTAYYKRKDEMRLSDGDIERLAYRTQSVGSELGKRRAQKRAARLLKQAN